MKGCRWIIRLLLVLLLALLFLLLRRMRRGRPAPGENVAAREDDRNSLFLNRRRLSKTQLLAFIRQKRQQA